MQLGFLTTQLLGIRDCPKTSADWQRQMFHFFEPPDDPNEYQKPNNRETLKHTIKNKIIEKQHKMQTLQPLKKQKFSRPSDLEDEEIPPPMRRASVP